jgi:hypothetical protein
MVCDFLRALLLCSLFLVGFTGCGDDSGSIAETIPEWARTGNFSFARWDGGPIEVTKATLSGWPGFLPADAQVIDATTNLYDPSTSASTTTPRTTAENCWNNSLPVRSRRRAK